MSNVVTPLKAGDPITVEPVAFFRLKADLMECSLLDERANAFFEKAAALVRQAATQRRTTMVKAGLDPAKSYQLEDGADGTCTVTEVVQPPTGGNGNG